MTLMISASAEFSLEKPNAYKAILWGGLIAGAIDITYACVYSYAMRGTSPVRILQSVASGLLGANSFTGGFPAAALGLFLHFFIACSAAVIYYAASRKLRVLVDQAIVCGVIYGALIYFFMNLMVLPLSAVPFPTALPAGAKLVIDLLVHTLGIGLPIALSVRRYSR